MTRPLVVVVFLLAACGDNADPPVTIDGAPVDMAIDTAVDRCARCTAGETCVQLFGGACSEAVECIATTETCAPGTCSPACEAALCASPYQCQIRPACGTEIAAAFTCYGP